MATGDLHRKFREDRSSGFRDMLVDRQMHRQTVDQNTPHLCRGGVKNGS